LQFEVACFGHGRTIEHGAQAAIAELDRRLEAPSKADGASGTSQGAAAGGE